MSCKDSICHFRLSFGSDFGAGGVQDSTAPVRTAFSIQQWHSQVEFWVRKVKFRVDSERPQTELSRTSAPPLPEASQSSSALNADGTRKMVVSETGRSGAARYAGGLAAGYPGHSKSTLTLLLYVQLEVAGSGVRRSCQQVT
eukprot:2046353-Rhodomonas_salina.2